MGDPITPDKSRMGLLAAIRQVLVNVFDASRDTLRTSAEVPPMKTRTVRAVSARAAWEVTDSNGNKVTAALGWKRITRIQNLGPGALRFSFGTGTQTAFINPGEILEGNFENVILSVAPDLMASEFIIQGGE